MPWRLVLVSWLALTWLPAPAFAIYIRHDTPVAAYGSLAADPAYAATGYLRSAGGQFCTGTLVSPTQVLSSAHCFFFPDGTLAVPSQVMFGTGDAIADFASNVAQLAVSPLFLPNVMDTIAFDLAVLTLSSPVLDISPAALWAGSPLGLVGTLVGYGAKGVGAGLPPAFTGAKLAAQNMIDTVGTWDTWRLDFDSPAANENSYGSPIPLPLEGTPARGDSGGPLWVTVAGTPYIVGTLFGGIGDDRYGDLSLYARIAREENLVFLRERGISVTGPAGPVPEPSTMTLLGLGLLGGWSRRRSRRLHQR